MEEKLAIGIDFGTTYSCIGAWIKGRIVIIPNSIGQRTSPSVIIFENKTKIYLCEDTVNYLSDKQIIKIYEIKRIIGKKYNEIKDIKNYFSFNIEEKKDNPIIKIKFENGEVVEYTPEKIACLIFKKLISSAQAYLKETITDIVVTVPADFNDTQRNAIKASAKSAGVKVLQIINEPSAAALAAGYFSLNKNNENLEKNDNKKKYIAGSNPHPMELEDKNAIMDLNESPLELGFLKKDIINNNEDDEESKYILVFDLGGGTYDVSLIEIMGTSLETIAAGGNEKLGGGDLDIILMEYCLDNFAANINIDKNTIRKNYKSMQKLKIVCEQTKKNLSFKENEIIFIEEFYNQESLSVSIDRKKFEELCKEFFDELEKPIAQVIEDAKKKETVKIDEIILVGGSSKIPKIKEILSKKFKDVPINDLINPDEAVAYGATLVCAKILKNNNSLLKSFNYFDSIQHSYGVETEDGEMEIILPKGSSYPTTKSKYFHNSYTNQINFEIKIYEGDNKYCKNNHYLGKFIVGNLPQMERGELIIKINFTINIDQILKITGSVGNDIKQGIEIKSDNHFENMEKINIKEINIFENDLKENENKFRKNIEELCKSYNKINNDDDEYALIKNYNEAIIAYLTFLEEEYSDIESEKFNYLIELLFKSYTYIFTQDKLKTKVTADDKINIENNAKQFIGIIGLKNPFKLKEMINIFKPIKREDSQIYYISSSYTIEILYQNGNKFLNLNNKNSSKVAQKFFEEALKIVDLLFKDNQTINLISNDLKEKFNKIKEECENNIKIIYVQFFDEIYYTKIFGKLFSNLNLQPDILKKKSESLYECLEKIKSIKDLNNNEDLLELKSICLANIVKIEFSLKEKKLSLDKLFDFAKESIEIVDKKLGGNFKKNWYYEIVELKNNIEKEKKIKEKNSLSELEEMRKKFDEKLNSDGEEEFLKYLLDNYPYEGYKKEDNIIDEFKKNRRRAIKRLKIKYDNYDDLSSTPLGSRNLKGDLTQKKGIIIEFINSLENFNNS